MKSLDDSINYIFVNSQDIGNGRPPFKSPNCDLKDYPNVKIYV